jgi:hypothetical protein
MSTLDLPKLLSSMCYTQNNVVAFDYVYFKKIANKETYDLIIQAILYNIDNVLTQYEQFDCHITLKMMTISDVDKHMSFWVKLTGVLRQRYQSQLAKCYIYDIPAFFAQCYNLVKCFIDKVTQDKIQLVQPLPLRL